MANKITSADILREWFDGERYARDYEYLDSNYGKAAERVLAFVRPASPSPTPADAVVEAIITRFEDLVLSSSHSEFRGLSDHAAFEAGQDNASAQFIAAIRALKGTFPAVDGWRTMDSAPKDGTPIDLWCINHLHHAKAGTRVVNVAWGPVRDWMGNERDDWQHGHGEDFEPTHWRPRPAAPSALVDPEPCVGCDGYNCDDGCAYPEGGV